MTATTDAAPGAQGQAREPGVSLPPLTGAALVVVSILLALANTIAVLDITIANVSVPHIAGAYGVSAHEGTWVITAYTIAEAITVVLSGWLVKRFGLVKVFVSAVVGFGICSLFCGLAPNFETLVPLRVLQGLCGGPMIPLSQALLLQVFPKEKAATATSVWALGSVVGPVLGPILGGVICDNWSWPWIFLINVPFTAVAAFFCWRFLRHRETPTERAPIDFIGLALLVLWVGCLLFVLEKGRDLDWFASPAIVALALMSAVTFCLFLIWELTDAHPIVDLRVLATPGFGLSVAILCVVFGGFFANEILSPLWMQTNLGYTATYAGLAACPHAVVLIFCAAPVQKLMGKVDNRWLIFFGLLVLAAATAWKATFASNVTFEILVLAQGTMGIGLAFMVLPLMPAVLGTLRPEDIPAGAGLMNFCRTTSMAFSAAIITTVWNDAASRNRVSLLNQMPDEASNAIGSLPAAQQPFVLDALVQDQSVMLATVQMYAALVFLILFAAACVWFLPRPRPSAGGAAVH